MRIGIDCRLWNESGVGRYIRNLVYNLQKLDEKNEYILFVLSKGHEKFKVQSSKFKVKIANVRWHTIAEQIGFSKVLNQENLDLMHFPYFSVPLFYNRPFVVTIHDLIVNHFPTGQASTLPSLIYSLKLLSYKFIIGRAAKKAKKILTVSNATKKEIVDHLKIKENKVVVTYEGVDNRISKIKNQKSKIDGKYFLYVGNAYPHKNLERLLEAFNILNADVNLILVGKEDYFYKRLKKKIIQVNPSKKVIFLQNVSDQELSDLYKNALALVFPSLMEGFGLPALEAMANKCLVLASDISALKEICADAAIYFNPADANDLVRKMQEIYPNDTYHYSDKKEKGLKRVKLFSWRKMAEQTLSVYEQSASKP
ncbi:MAG: glycosyltransferase family 4 protein [Candidatus Levybacteria bacterium]|nr:glycosyltransferase family 4 protein [Candidatus Levybacteria bacterium]